MVKADVKIDYYAALGLPPNAEIEEIKKQFRKLALIWHPDRNPGKENEVNSKFQAIQAAHEILTDPHQRLKYDTDRLRAGYGRVSGPAKAGPVPRQSRNSHFSTASPQKGPAFGYENRPAASYAQPPPSAGAQKYTGYARAGAAKWDKTHDDARTRADAFRGFQDMKNSRSNPPGWYHFDPHTGHPVYPDGRSDGSGKPRPQSRRHQSAYEAFFGKQPSAGPQRAQTTKKRTGFTPWTPGGDEPMAKNTSAYVHNSTRSERFQDYFEAAQPPTAKKTSERDHLTPNLERTSTRYSAVGGDKIHVSGDGLGRSTNPRNSSPAGSDSRSQTNPPSPKSPQPERTTRHRSASPQMKPHRNEQNAPPSPTSTSSSDSDEVFPNFRPKAIPRSRKFAGAAQCTKYPNPNNYGVAFGLDSWLFDETPGCPAPGKPNSQADFWDYNANDGSSDLASRTSQASHKPTVDAVPNASHQATDGSQSVYEGAQWSDGGVKTKTRPSSNRLAPEREDAIYSQDSSNQPKSKGGETLGDIFARSNWVKACSQRPKKHEQFKFGNTVGGKGTKGTSRKTDSARDSNARPEAPSGGIGGNRTSYAPDERTSKSAQAEPNFSQMQFSPELWHGMFDKNTWSMPQDESRQRQQPESRRQKSPKKQSKAVPKRSAVPQHASVRTEAEEAEATQDPDPSVNPQPKPGNDEEVMDVDDDTSALRPQNAPGASQQKATKEQSPANIKPDPSTKPFLDLKNLESVSPFTSTNSGGINDLQDLNSTLPFDSKPADGAHASVNIRPRDLALPKPPKPPSTPTVYSVAPKPGAFPEQALTRAAWDQYIAEMGTYMFEWNDFNRKMLGHFNARQAIVETGLSPNWMKAVGDTSRLNVNGGDEPRDDEQLVLGQAKGGFGAYLRGVEEDFVVREHWSVAWERHRECILVLGRVREWIRGGGKIH